MLCCTRVVASSISVGGSCCVLCGDSLQVDGFFVLLFDRTLPGLEISSVVVNNLESSYKAVKHLIDNGYSNIAMITLLSDQTQMFDRKLGYMKALDEAKKPYLLKKIAYHDKRENCIQEIRDFVYANKEIDALFFATNYLAESGLEALKLLKRSIPEDIGIVVFDDHYLFKLFTPSITVRRLIMMVNLPRRYLRIWRAGLEKACLSRTQS